jgi:hypothetical protein
MAAVGVLAQAPVNDQVKVEFTNSVTVGDKILMPGKYEIRRLPTANNPLIFEFVSEDGTRTEATASATPIVDNLARHPTSVILSQNGNTAYVSRLWIAGETYGYEFTPPTGDNVTSLAAERTTRGDTRLTATYSPDKAAVQTPAAEQQQADAAAQRQREDEQRREEERLRAERERAAQQQQAELERQRQQAAQRAAAEQAERAERERAERERAERERIEIAQARPQEPPPQAPATPPAGGAQQMPATAGSWPTLIVAGLSLFGLGAFTRRFTR